jgi:hypothetical protein
MCEAAPPKIKLQLEEEMERRVANLELIKHMKSHCYDPVHGNISNTPYSEFMETSRKLVRCAENFQ